MDWGFSTKKSLGIDIGVSSIKVVEVAVIGKTKRLENYFEFFFPSSSDFLKGAAEENFLVDVEESAEVLNSLLQKIGVKQRKAAFAIPDFSTFFTTFTLPPMSEQEVAEAVKFEARHHIPVPLSQVSFDWKVIKNHNNSLGEKLQVLLVAVPNRVLESYQKIAMLCGLELRGMEAEVFGLVRSAVPKEMQGVAVCLVDFGWQSTTVSIVKENTVRLSHSFDISGTHLTKDISQNMKVSLEKAEKLKKEYGLNPEKNDVYQSIVGRVDNLVSQIDRICRGFFQEENTEVAGVILSGGTAWLGGLQDYMASKLGKKITMADPFSGLDYPVVLRERLKEVGPSFAVALGVGLMGAES